MSFPQIYRPNILNSCLRGRQRIRFVSTLPNNSHIYYFPDPANRSSSILSYLPSSPPVYSLSIGHTTAIPPTPSTFTTNPNFLRILQSVIAKYATKDPIVQSQAAAYASRGGSSLGSGGFLFPSNHPSQRSSSEKRSRAPGPGHASTSGAGPTASQGGMGGAGRGGFLHVSDMRHPPDFGRIAEPEDIFGSVEVDGNGQFVNENGNYQESGTYRIITRDGILGISDFIRERLVEKLKELERAGRES